MQISWGASGAPLGDFGIANDVIFGVVSRSLLECFFNGVFLYEKGGLFFSPENCDDF